MEAIAWGKQLLFSLFVWDVNILNRLPEGSGSNSEWPGWVGSVVMPLAFFLRFWRGLRCWRSPSLLLFQMCEEEHGLCFCTSSEVNHNLVGLRAVKDQVTVLAAASLVFHLIHVCCCFIIVGDQTNSCCIVCRDVKNQPGGRPVFKVIVDDVHLSTLTYCGCSVAKSIGLQLVWILWWTDLMMSAFRYFLSLLASWFQLIFYCQSIKALMVGVAQGLRIANPLFLKKKKEKKRERER